MMQAIKQSSLPKKWYLLCATADKSSEMAFDRFRIDGDTSSIKVGVFFTDDDAGTLFTEGDKHYVTQSPRQIQPFHSGGGWTTASYEHDFSFDLTGSKPHDANTTNGSTIVISGLKPENKIYQVYAAPVGYSATRNKNASIISWHHGVGKVQAGGGDIGRLRLENQGYNVDAMSSMFGGQPKPIYAKEFDLRGSEPIYVDYAFQQLVDGGETNGTFRFDNASVNSQSNKSTLESRGWTISGTVATS